MNSELLDIGTQCSHAECRNVDFLPIRCSCQLAFCQAHISQDAHSCPLRQAYMPHSDLGPKFQRCAVEKCNKTSLDAFVAVDAKDASACSQCHRAYCAE